MSNSDPRDPNFDESLYDFFTLGLLPFRITGAGYSIFDGRDQVPACCFYAYFMNLSQPFYERSSSVLAL
jgi:hypothetical protein